MYQRVSRDHKAFDSFQQYIEREEGKEMERDERIEKQYGVVLRLRSNGFL